MYAKKLESCLIIFRIRDSTYERLKLLRGGVLSEVLRHILPRDPLAPVLWEQYYTALNRRLELILQTIDKCIIAHGASHVLVKDDLQSIHSQHWFLLYCRAVLNGISTNFVIHYADDQIWIDIINTLYIVIAIAGARWIRQRLMTSNWITSSFIRARFRTIW